MPTYLLPFRLAIPYLSLTLHLFVLLRDYLRVLFSLCACRVAESGDRDIRYAKNRTREIQIWRVRQGCLVHTAGLEGACLVDLQRTPALSSWYCCYRQRCHPPKQQRQARAALGLRPCLQDNSKDTVRAHQPTRQETRHQAA